MVAVISLLVVREKKETMFLKIESNPQETIKKNCPFCSANLPDLGITCLYYNIKIVGSLLFV